MLLRIALLTALVGSAAAASAGAGVVAVYPNPATDGDRGEFVVVRVPPDTDLGGFALADGESVAGLPNRTVSGRVALSTAPAVARDRTDLPVVGLNGTLRLANGGERIELRRDGRRIDAVTYPSAPEGERWLPNESVDAGGSWQSLGATAFEPQHVDDAEIRTFALPDAPAVPLSVLRSADDRLYLAGYTFTSERVGAALRAAAERGVDVRVLVDGGPVGGVSAAERRVLDSVSAAGATVTVVDGPLARYRFHHAKYAAVDGRAVVTSENWKPSGTGGDGNRGWGVVVENATFAADLARVFEADAGWRDGVSWARYRANATFHSSNRTAETAYPTRFVPVDATADAKLLVAPENAERGILELIRSANETLAVEQVSVANGSSFLRETVAAARRGVRVRVLLSGTWYVREENAALVAHLERVAAREDLDLSARLVEPRSRFEKIHVKGVVADGERVLVGSVNWNPTSARENREVAVVLSGDRVGRYYQRLFLADWRGGAWRVPATLLALVVTSACAATAALWRRVRFAPG